MSAIYDDKYVFTDISDHYEMSMTIEKNFGSFTMWLASATQELNIIACFLDITSNQIQIVINVLLELQNYYLNTNNKKVHFITSFNDYLEKSEYSCNEIDEVINKLYFIKDELLKNVR